MFPPSKTGRPARFSLGFLSVKPKACPTMIKKEGGGRTVVFLSFGLVHDSLSLRRFFVGPHQETLRACSSSSSSGACPFSLESSPPVFLARCACGGWAREVNPPRYLLFVLRRDPKPREAGGRRARGGTFFPLLGGPPFKKEMI